MAEMGGVHPAHEIHEISEVASDSAASARGSSSKIGNRLAARYQIRMTAAITPT